MSSSDTKKYVCDSCGQHYSFYSALYRHRKRFHKMKYPFKADCPKPDVDPDNSVNTDFLPRCRMCNEFFVKNRCCGPDTENICEFCTKSLIEVGALEAQTKKKPEKRHVCDLCEKKFRCKSQLKAHLIVHRNEKQFKCDECGKAFNEKKIRDLHKVTHLGLKPFSCSLCNKIYAKHCDLRLHFRKHVREVVSETKIKEEPK